jgi:hypothetical protein
MFAPCVGRAAAALILEKTFELFLLPLFGAAIDFFLIVDDAAELIDDFVVRFEL